MKYTGSFFIPMILFSFAAQFRNRIDLPFSSLMGIVDPYV
jgi:hypothetical protein